MNSRKERVIELFNEKYNCAQALFAVYSDMFGIDRDTAMKIAAGFGGGVAGLGKTCGAINAAVMIIGLKYGNTDKLDVNRKVKTRETIRNFMNDFNEKHMQINCKDLLQEEKGKKYPMHSEKCVQVLEEICDLLDIYLEE